MFRSLIDFIRKIYGVNGFIALHEPLIGDLEKEYINKVLDSGFVSSVGEEVKEFERQISSFVGAKFAIATSNGTSALHAALLVAGVQPKDEVITQSLTFVATSNAIHYCNANPIFIDVDRSNLGLSEDSLEDFLTKNCEIRDDGFCWNRATKKIVRACVPMHTFGLSANLFEIREICNRYNIVLIEDAAESLGTKNKNSHSGTIGDLGIISFNGNKIITTGGGGIVVTNNQAMARKLKHLTTTAKVSHEWNFSHDMVGYNYRMPNLNAALGLAQLQRLNEYIQIKRDIALSYQSWGERNGFNFVKELSGTRSNYWLNTMLVEDREERDLLLKETNDHSIMTRPAWDPVHLMTANTHCQRDSLENTNWLADRIVNLPSGVPKNEH
ncbi:LegC family aminotransferase [Gammaproteobacteria bacterium]|nr:LegC family aminotransferase [Gammaproteobacteria bacterium]